MQFAAFGGSNDVLVLLLGQFKRGEENIKWIMELISQWQNDKTMQNMTKDQQQYTKHNRTKWHLYFTCKIMISSQLGWTNIIYQWYSNGANLHILLLFWFFHKFLVNLVWYNKGKLCYVCS